MKVTFLKVAEAELDDAFEYYESVQSGLGFRFLTEVELSMTRIIKFPFSYEEIGKYSRTCLAHIRDFFFSKLLISRYRWFYTRKSPLKSMAFFLNSP